MYILLVIIILQSGLWSNLSHTIYFVCVNFIHFIQMFEHLYLLFYLLSEYLPGGSRRQNIFSYFVLR